MRRQLAAAAVSGGIGVVTWSIFALVGSRLLDVEGLEVLFRYLGLIVVGLFIFVLAPLLAGFGGGLASRTLSAVAGSVAGYVAVFVGATLVRADEADPSAEGFLVGGVLSVGLVLAGHLTGVAVRPRLRAA